VATSPDERWLVTGSEDKTARLWDLTAKDPAANPVVLRGHDGKVSAAAISVALPLTVGMDIGLYSSFPIVKSNLPCP
jgi:WD40 repeat protein